MPTINPQIAVTADDGFWSGTFNNATPSLRIGNSAGAATAWFRFTGITLGGTIIAAYLDLQAGAGSTAVTPVIVSAEDAANPTAPTSIEDGNGRVKTTNTVAWNLGTGDAWTAGVRYNTPSLVAVVQELVDSYGPYNDGVMQFFIADNGSVTNVNRAIRDYTAGATVSAKLYIEYESANATPTITPNTVDEATFTTLTPTIEFTGADAESDDLRYQVQISTSPDFLPNGVQVTDSEINSGSSQLTIHPNPDVSATTWEGKIVVDDRPGQVFRGAGGILDKMEFSFGPHESYPEDTDGEYLCRIYAIEGVRGDNVPVWQASTVYTAGQMVRNTNSANADQQFLYVCITGGTSGSTQPTWTEIENDTINDGSVVWEAHRGAGPLNYAAPANTPTPNWLAQSNIVAYAPGTTDSGWKTCSFTGGNRIRLEAGAWYCAILDWWPANRVSTNTLNVLVRISSTNPGNCYIDGAQPTNNGPRVGDDTVFRAYEDHVLLDKTSGTDNGFANTVTPADTDPFNAGEKVSYTVQAGDALVDDVTYYWRVRAFDPSPGGNHWSEWTATRSFTVVVSGGTTYNQSASGSVTLTGSAILQTAKALAGSVTLIGVAILQTAKALVGSVTGAGSAIRRAAKTLSGSVTTAGFLDAVRQAGLYILDLAGSITMGGGITRRVGKLAAGTTTAASTLARSIAKQTTGSMAASGTVEKIKVVLRFLTGSVVMAGSLGKQTAKRVLGLVTASGLLTRAYTFLRSLSGSITGTGSVVKLVVKTVVGTITTSGTVQSLRAFLLALAGSIATSGGLIRQTAKRNLGSIAASGTVARVSTFLRALSGSITGTGVTIKQAAKNISGAITASGAVQAVKALLLTLTGSITASGVVQVTRSLLLTLAGSVAASGGLARRVSKTLSRSITATGSLARRASNDIGDDPEILLAAIVGIFSGKSVRSALASLYAIVRPGATRVGVDANKLASSVAGGRSSGQRLPQGVMGGQEGANLPAAPIGSQQGRKDTDAPVGGHQGR